MNEPIEAVELTSENHESFVADTEPGKEDDPSLMNERQKRLFQIRLKMNQGRKANKVEVENEYKRLTDPKFGKRKEYENKFDKKGEGAISDAVDAVLDEDNWKKISKEEQMLSTTANDSLQHREKNEKKEKNKATFGWQAFTTEASYRAYKKSLKHLPGKINEEEEGKEYHDNVLSLEDKLLSGQGSSTKIQSEALERLGKHLVDKEKDREKFSRRRMHIDSGEVDYINEANAKFNKKIKRSFDKYTVEIRQNLERGTAV